MRSSVALLAGVVVAAGAGAATDAPAVVRPLTPAERAAMTPEVWRPGCPVALRDLRRVVVPYSDLRGRERRGALVVHRDVARDVARVFVRLHGARFPIRRMLPIERFGGDDTASIAAGNTSAFNCRAVTGGAGWSEHAYGRAIDVNPLENPYVSGGRTIHPASVRYLDRTRVRPGMAVEGGVLVRAFDAIGWGWGGRWTEPVDYQHFSESGG